MKTHSTIWLGAVAAACMLACNPASAQSAVNLVSNGSFETGDFNGWLHTFPTGQANPGFVQCNSTVTAGEPASPNDPDPIGACFATFYGDKDKEKFEQRVYLNAGSYIAGFSAYPFDYQNTFQESFCFDVDNVPIACINSANYAANTWYLIANTFTETSPGWHTVTLLYKSGAAPAKDMYVDMAYLVCTTITGC